MYPSRRQVMSAPTELVKGNASILILSCLARESMHGYRIVKQLEQMSEGYFAMREGTLYPHLHQLEKDGLVEGYWETVTGGRERKMYRITENGRTELARKRREWETFRSNVNRVLGVEGTGA
jgi:PadR family transcriptional regulator, regulatory protein PadR